MKNTKIWFVTLIMTVLVAVCIIFKDTFLLLLGACFIAFLLTPIADFFQKLFHTKGRFLPTLLACLIALIVIGGILFLIFPPLIKQIENVVGDIDDYIEELSSIFDNFATKMSALGISEKLISVIDSAISSLGSTVISVVTSIGTYILQKTTKIGNLVILVILIIYFTKDGSLLISNCLNFFGEYTKIRMRRMGGELNDLIWGYLKVKVLTSLLVFAITLLFYTLLGIPNALLLAMIAFLLEFIPYFGPIISAIISVVAAIITNGFPTAIWVAVANIIIQQIDGNIIEPIVQGKKANVHPIAVIVSLLVCEKLWGILGMLLACPLAGFAKVLLFEIRDLYHSIDSPFGFGYATPEPLITAENIDETKSSKFVKRIGSKVIGAKKTKKEKNSK